MRRQSVILAAFFAFFFATFAPIRAQESASTDANAGIMLTATDGVAFTSLEALARDYCGYASSPPSGFSLNYYQLGLVDLPDPGVYDCWLFAYGFLSSVESNGTITAAGGKLGQLVVIRLGNGNWATTSGIGTVNVASGYWPVYFRIVDGDLQGVTFYGNSNVADLDRGVASSFMSNFRDFVVASQNLPITDSVITSLYDYARLNNYETYDADGGGVIDLVEWVQGTALDNCFDDNVSMNDVDCVCGACCSCECICGKWGGAECGKTSSDCECHPKEPDCTCGDYCCACECQCEKCADGTHNAHENGSDTCDGTEGDTIGFAGCDCHKTTEEPECECANFCCKHTCKCEKCGDGEHSAHKNDNGSCDGTFENCSDCHEEENPDEECTCANYCCACKCECEKCKAAGSCSGNHKNGDSKCDGVSSGSNYVCSCHGSTNPENPEEETCTCANYCCYHTCECKRCASLPAASHSQHQNGSPTCNGTTSSGGCVCHETSDDGKFEAPDDPEFEVPEDEKNKEFISGQEKFKPSIERLEKAFEDKYQIKNVTKYFSGDLTGALPSWEFELPGDWGVARVDFNDLEKYDEQLATVRAVLVALVYLLTAVYVLQSLRKLV